MQPSHHAAVYPSHPPPLPFLVSSSPPHSVLPLARTVSSSSGSSKGFSASLTHHRRGDSQSHRLSTQTLSTSPPQTSAVKLSASALFVFSLFPPISLPYLDICPPERRIWWGCPQLASLGWEFTSELILYLQELSTRVINLYPEIARFFLNYFFRGGGGASFRTVFVLYTSGSD